jgi:hypothetical protein
VQVATRRDASVQQSFGEHQQKPSLQLAADCFDGLLSGPVRRQW